jgi:hypothetical protein
MLQTTCLLVAVSQEADADGCVLGVKISLFDASNAAKNPVQLQNFVADQQDPNVYSASSSVVQWGFKAFH